VPNVFRTVIVYTFHIQGTAPRSAISIETRPIMALQILDSIVDGNPVPTVTVIHKTIWVLFKGYSYSSLLENRFAVRNL
jgi:hypothetical protein